MDVADIVETAPNTRFLRAVRVGDVAENAPLGLIVGGWPLLLVRSEGSVHALIDRCPHAASPLSTGRVRRGSVMCPLHGARFDLVTGRCLGGAYKDVRVFETRMDGDWIEIAVPQQSPAGDQVPVTLPGPVAACDSERS